MELKEAQLMRVAAAMAIKTILEEYQKETGLCPNAVFVDHYDTMEGSRKILSVEVEVNL